MLKFAADVYEAFVAVLVVLVLMLVDILVEIQVDMLSWMLVEIGNAGDAWGPTA